VEDLSTVTVIAPVAAPVLCARIPGAPTPEAATVAFCKLMLTAPAVPLPWVLPR